jgi:hypothetical protein
LGVRRLREAHNAEAIIGRAHRRLREGSSGERRLIEGSERRTAQRQSTIERGLIGSEKGSLTAQRCSQRRGNHRLGSEKAQKAHKRESV